MIKQEIIEKISKYFKLTHFEAEKIYDDIFKGIITGVKEDNIADITNLGEFIIKYNNEDEAQKKTVEFLPTLSLEDEINQRPAEEQKILTSEQPPIHHTVAEQTVITETKSVVEAVTNTDDKANVEDEIKKKRDEILNKITTPKDENAVLHRQETTEVKQTIIAPVVVPPVVTSAEQVTENIVNGIKETKETVTEKTTESFSDYFTEIKEEKTFTQESINKTVIPPVENVIPPTAVELHNQITGDQVYKDPNYQPTLNPPPYPNGNGNGNGNGSGNGNTSEHVAQDNSYYIWYKDSEPNVTDTQTMSYEYELLYQATKEAEYKSKLRIYVTTFIMFFSIVLLLLILSPVIYKYFFTPSEEQQTEEVQETSDNGIEPTQDQSTASSLQNNNTQSTQSASDQNTQSNTQNTQQSNTQPNNTQSTQSTQQTEQPKQEQPKQEQPKEQPKQETKPPVTQNNTQQNQPQSSAPPQTNSSKVDGVTKNSMGWMDDKNRVIYVQLENGKFTIQESAWDSDAKANKRISVVGGIVPGLKGSVVKADLGSKGVWYRTRFGEFATIEEAKAKAEELRTKETKRLQALLLSFLLYA